MKPKLILTDLDGTLLDAEKHVPPANRAALERAAAQGAQVVIATGRFYPGIPQELRELPFLRYFILMNGAKVYDRVEDRILYRAEIDLELAERIFDVLEPLDISVDCYQKDQGLMARRHYDRLDYYVRNLESRIITRTTRRPVDDLRAAVRANGSPLQKIQCYFPNLELRRPLMERLNQMFPELALSISMPSNLEINAAHANKGEALLALCRALSVDPLDTVAFGDGTNDLTMLQSAGVGVAMANGDPEVLAVADLVAPPNTEDGVAQILNQLYKG